MEEKKKYKRRKNYLINKPLQFAYAGIAVWFLLIAIILVGTFTYYITLNTILNQLQIENQLVDANRIVSIINSILIKRIGILFTLVIFFALILEILFLHRIAGPIYRIEKTLNDIADGKEVQPIKLRKKDFFKSLATSVNKVIEKINKMD